MQRLLAGMLYGLLWYGSIFCGFLLMTLPSFLVMIISPPAFRQFGDFIFSFWEVYNTLLLHSFGVKIVVSGDHIKYNDSAILVMNHRTRTDWNFLWSAMYQACLPKVTAHKLKMILKDSVRHLPGPGWVMQMCGFFYITRRWEEDQRRLTRCLDYVIALQSKIQLLIFPEGTDLNDKSKIKSDSYADKNGLPKFDYTLHPKTTGFSFLTKHLKRANFLDAVYDITIGYPDIIPQTELDIFWGLFPSEVHVNIKRIAATELPDEESQLRVWLEQRWVQKEQVLANFEKRKSFEDERWTTFNWIPLYIAGVFWTALMATSTLLLIISPLFRIVVLLQSLFFIGLSFLNINFGQLEVAYYNIWKRTSKNKLN